MDGGSGQLPILELCRLVLFIKNYYVEIINEPKLIGATENRQLSRPSIHMRGCGYAGLIHRCACVDVSS